MSNFTLSPAKSSREIGLPFSLRQVIVTVALVCAPVVNGPLWAQQSAPSEIGDSEGLFVLQGSVVDGTGAAVTRANVLAQCGPYRSDAVSNGLGQYRVELRQSTCTITVNASGFSAFSRVVDRRKTRGEMQVQLSLANQETVTVSARQDAVDVAKIGADPMDLPLAVESVPIKLVQDQGFTRLIDALRNVSGVVLEEAYFGVTDDFSIRGFDASSSLFNGFRRDYYGTVNDLSSVERIEVIKGPSSVTEGFLEPGGIVNTVTKRPQQGFGSEFSLLAGTYGTVRATGDVNLPLGHRVFLRGTGALEHRASWRDYVQSNIEHAGVALDWVPTPSTLLESRFYNTYLDGVPDRGLVPVIAFQDVLALPIQRYFGDPEDRYRQRNTNISEMVRQGLGKSWSFRTGVNFFQLSDYRNNVEVDNADPTDPNLVVRELTIVPGDSSTVNAIGEFAGEATTFRIHHHITAGVDYQRLYSYNFFTENFSLPLFDPRQPNYGGYDRIEGVPTYWYYGYTYDTGTYAQDLVSFGKHIRVLAGARQDQFNYHDHELVGMTTVRLRQGAFSPRVGVVYQPISSFSLYANYASSFNPQQGVQLLNGDDPTPSRGRQVEIGMKWNAGGRLTAAADLFRIRKTNVATPVPNHGDFEQLTGEEQSTGAELDGTLVVRRGLSIRANIADIRAIVSADTAIPVGDRLQNVPRLQGTVWIEFAIPRTKLTTNFGWYAVGQRELLLPNIDPLSGRSDLIPKYNRFDIAAAYPVRSDLRLQVNLQNISDVKYYTSQGFLLYPGAPTNAEFSLRWTPKGRR